MVDSQYICGDNLVKNDLPKIVHVCGKKRLKRRRGILGKAIFDQAVNVGLVIHTLRTERDLTIRDLAEKSGLAINTLSLIENAKTSPCVGTLQQLATALEVPITAFFEPSAPKNCVVCNKSIHRSGEAFAQGMLEDLGVGLNERAIEPFIITINPTASNDMQPVIHTGVEFVYCLEGQIMYTIEDKIYLLEPGDSMLFEAHLSHRWQNVAVVPSRMLLVLCSTDLRDQSAQHHFLSQALGKREPILS